MRLLSKNEISHNKALERKSQIDEGLKIARKVDSLRQTLLSEEQRLEIFRKSTVGEIQKQIDALILKRDELAEQVKLLEEDKKEEFIVKFGIELDKIKAKEKLIEDGYKTNLNTEEILKNKEKNLKSQEENTQIELNRVKNLKLRAEEALRLAEDNKRKASKVLENAEKEESKRLLEAAERTNYLNIREATIATQEKEIQMKIEYIAEKELEFIEREKALTDKYETLQRTINRIKHKI